MGNNINDDVIVLGGREFRRVKNGLDEAQVAAFITELVSERDKLIQSQVHIASLSRLAEKTVAEADSLAEFESLLDQVYEAYRGQPIGEGPLTPSYEEVFQKRQRELARGE